MPEAHVERRSPAAYVARTHGPSAPAALKAGFIAGTVALILLQLFAIAIYDESPWQLARMTAALVRGPGALEPNDEYDAALVAIGTLLHFSLALLYALALACVVAEAAPQHALLIGLAFGAALYFVNFYGFTALFPWFAPHRTIDTLLVHMVFGAIIATGYWVFDRTAR
jgi:hypothetical protein